MFWQDEIKTILFEKIVDTQLASDMTKKSTIPFCKLWFKRTPLVESILQLTHMIQIRKWISATMWKCKCGIERRWPNLYCNECQLNYGEIQSSIPLMEYNNIWCCYWCKVSTLEVESVDLVSTINTNNGKFASAVLN